MSINDFKNDFVQFDYANQGRLGYCPPMDCYFIADCEYIGTDGVKRVDGLKADSERNLIKIQMIWDDEGAGCLRADRNQHNRG